MNATLAMNCPECGSLLPAEQRPTHSCEGCGRSYVNWFGNLIPAQAASSLEGE